MRGQAGPLIPPPPLCRFAAAGDDNGCSFQRPRGIRPPPPSSREQGRKEVSGRVISHLAGVCTFPAVLSEAGLREV